MSNHSKPGAGDRPDDRALQELTAQSETGARHPGGAAGEVLLRTALAWSLFQLWYASPLPFLSGVLVLNDTEARAIHLGPHAPDALAYKGASVSKAMSHLWLSTEGVFGIALGVSTSFVFMFVLFGSLLDKAGAGNDFIKVAFALLGHMRGGPAKAAVLSSGLTGLISGSSIANVVTPGTFTNPLMKPVGFTSVAFTLFRPGFWWDMIYPPLIEVDPAEIVQAAADVPDGGSLRLQAEGLSIEGDEVARTVMLPMGPAGPGEARLAAAGLELREEDGRVLIDRIGFGSAAEKGGRRVRLRDYERARVSERPPKELMWLPALAVLGLIIWLQRRRSPTLAPAIVTVATGGA